MKTGTSTHRKTLRLRRALGMKPYEVVGILETIWEMTAKNCPNGDLGIYENIDIADYLGWPRDDIDRLIEILIAEKWLDKVDDPEIRFVVHDWQEHCATWVKKKAVKLSAGKELGESKKDLKNPKGKSIAHGHDTKIKTKTKIKTIPPISPTEKNWEDFNSLIVTKATLSILKDSAFQSITLTN